MTFDPSGGFAMRGYLRNTAGLHDPAEVKEYEHRAFLARLDHAFATLAPIARLAFRACSIRIPSRSTADRIRR